MKRLLRALALLLLLAAVPVRPARAAESPTALRTDDLTECLLRSTSPADRTLLVQWIFALVALHPDVQSVALVSDSTRTVLNRGVARLMERLLTESCPAQARAAIKAQGPKAFESSFGVLGQVATQSLFTSPQVTAGMNEFVAFFDVAKLQATLMSEGQ